MPDIDKADLVAQVQVIQGKVSSLSRALREGTDKAAFLEGIKDAEDELKRLRALLIHHTRVHGAGIRKDGKRDLRFSRNRLAPPAVDLRKPLKSL